jgi:tRNA(Met) C34 N-acetyltransferase TmcA
LTTECPWKIKQSNGYTIIRFWDACGFRFTYISSHRCRSL